MFSVPPVLAIQAQLYIGDLDPDTKELDLFQILRPYGEITMIKVLKSHSTLNKKFAFISFKDPISTSKVRRELNGTKLLSSQIRICRVTKDLDQSANIFIKNIPLSANLQSLEEKFDAFGVIVSSKIVFSEKGVSLGYGFIQFESSLQARKAITEMNGFEWLDSKLAVSEYLPVTSRTFSNKSNLYIKNFPLAYTQDDIKKIFSKFGEIVSLAIATTYQKDSAKAYGFVCFQSEESARRAYESLHGQKEDSFEWCVVPHMNKVTRKAYLREIYKKQIEDWKKRNLYIRNIHSSICENKLRDIFLPYGEITSLKIVKAELIKYNADGEMSKQITSKGVGFVCYLTESSAAKALKEVQEKIIMGTFLFIARWRPRNEMKKLIFNKKILKKKQGDFRYSANSEVIKRFPMPVMIRPFPVPLCLSREELGEKIFSVAVKITNEMIAGKITGMILDLGVPTANNLFTNEQGLKQKILEAVEVLRKAWANNPGQLKILPN